MARLLYRTSLLLIMLTAPATMLADDGDGGYAGAYFQIPVGARPAALGGAYLAISNDGAGPLYNPAGIATAEKKLFATSYRAMDLDRSLGYATFILPTRERSAIGLNLHYFGAGDVAMRDRNGREVAPEGLGPDIGFTSLAASIVFAKRFEDYLAVGMKAAYLNATFAEMSAFSVGIDVGLMLYTDYFFDRETRHQRAVRDVRVGVVVKNLAAKYRWNSGEYNEVATGGPGVEQADDVPIEVGAGLSGRLLDRKLLLTSDLIKNEKQNLRYHGGAEYFVVPEFALRGGYSDGRLTAGTGFVFHVGSRVLAIDYAFATDKVDEGSEHIFSFDLLF